VDGGGRKEGRLPYWQAPLGEFFALAPEPLRDR
jgi:hypothetical protein